MINETNQLQQPSPGTRKVTIGALGSAVVTVLAMLFNWYGKPLPPELTAACSTLVAAFLTDFTTETYS